jgi:hypothetical protein
VTGSLTEVLPSAFALLGLDTDDRLGLAERLGTPQRIVLVLVDGLGYHLLPRAAQAAPLFADVLAGGAGRLDELACTLPSTTPTSLVSLGTGVAPGEHGIVGFTVNIPGTDRVLTHILWRTDPPVATWAPVPTLFARAADAGIASTVVLPAPFEGSGLTAAAYGGARFVPLARADDKTTAILNALDGGARFVYGYTPAMDSAMHGHGLGSPEWAAAAARTGAFLGRLQAALPRDTALLVTSDHGGLDIPATARLDLADDPRLSAGLRVVAGEPRFRHLYTKPGASGDVLAAWSAVLTHRADVLTREEVLTTGLLGPVRPQFVERIGDVVMISRGDTAVFATGHEPAEVSWLVGLHGARTPAETAIPLISFAAH